MIYRIKTIKIEAENVGFIAMITRLIDTYFPYREATTEEMQEFARNTRIDKIINRNNYMIVSIISEESEICKITIEKLED